MAQVIFTADLLNTQPPYNPKELGSACVFASEAETARRQGALHGVEADRQYGYNQVFFIDNCMPTARGYASVGYQSTVAPPPNGLVPEYVLECRGAAGELSYVAVAQGTVLQWNSDNTWTPYTTITADPLFVPQMAVVRGTSYVFFNTFTVYRFDFILGELVPIDIQPIDMGVIQGICSGGSQLVMYSSDMLYYSAMLDTSDFQPSLETGAGSTAVLSLKGTIVTVVPQGQDFVIYTQYSAIYASSTGNFAFPFVYSEIPGSTGIITQNHVAYNANTGTHVVYTNAGMQEITKAGAQAIFPEISDGLSKGVVPEINPINGIPTYALYPALNIKLNFIANRYLSVSVGIDPIVNSYDFAWIYDTSLRRWGRLTATHTAVFEWAGTAAVEGLRTYQDLANEYPIYNMMEGTLYRDLGNLAAKFSALNKQKIAIMSGAGHLCIMAQTENGQAIGNNEGTDAAMPRLVLGRVKVSRDQGIMTQWFRVNRLVGAELVIHGHDHIGNFIRQYAELTPDKRQPGTYFARLSCDSVSIEVRGAFILSELIICCLTAGNHVQFYAAPKKLERLLVSEVFPLAGVSEPVQASVAKAGAFLAWEPTEEISASVTSVSMELWQPIINLDAEDPDSLRVGDVVVTASLVRPIVNVDAVEPDVLQITAVYVSATLRRTVILHNQPLEDYLQTVPITVTGSLSNV